MTILRESRDRFREDHDDSRARWDHQQRLRRSAIIAIGKHHPGATLELCAQSYDESRNLWMNPLTGEWELRDFDGSYNISWLSKDEIHTPPAPRKWWQR